jgi:DNA modification methylase
VWEIRHGDALEGLRDLSDGSVQCCVTSPPYYRLRDYGVDGQIGLEASPSEYVKVLVEVFAEVRRVLADDGTLWLNLGDTYNNRAVIRPSSHQSGFGFESDHLSMPWSAHVAAGRVRRTTREDGCKEKDLLGIPWLVAFALRRDGWYLRRDVIWSKGADRESVTDRPKTSHEYLFLFSKRPSYVFNRDVLPESGSVWEIPTRPFLGEHFATFPPDLAERCVLAGSRVGDTVLDPFSGAATTGVVAIRHGRGFVGVELSAASVELGRRRIDDMAGVPRLAGVGEGEAQDG